MKYKIIHILGTIITGGAELSVYDVLKSWKDNQFSQKILYTRELKGKKVAFHEIGIPTIPLNWNSERNFHKIFALMKVFQREKPHIVNTHITTGNYWVVIAAKLANVPIIIETMRTKIELTKKGFLLHKVLRPIVSPFIDITICISSAVKNHMIALFGNSSKRYQLIFNGLQSISNTKRIDMTSNKPTINVPKNAVILLTIANLRPFVKGYEIYIDALNTLSPEFRGKIHVLIVGDKSQDNPDFLSVLEKRIKESQLKNMITFLGVRTDIKDLISVSDVIVMPSMYEGGPRVVLEAMRGGKPVIATRTGAVPEYVVDGETGLIVEPGDSKALAAAIENMLDNPVSWAEMGERGKKRFLEHFTVDKTVDQLTNLYLDLLEKKGIKHTDSNALHLD